MWAGGAVWLKLYPSFHFFMANSRIQAISNVYFPELFSVSIFKFFAFLGFPLNPETGTGKKKSKFSCNFSYNQCCMNNCLVGHNLRYFLRRVIFRATYVASANEFFLWLYHVIIQIARQVEETLPRVTRVQQLRVSQSVIKLQLATQVELREKLPSVCC